MILWDVGDKRGLIRIHNASSEPCDVNDGPCVCGAWHEPIEFAARLSKVVGYEVTPEQVTRVVEVVSES